MRISWLRTFLVRGFCCFIKFFVGVCFKVNYFQFFRAGRTVSQSSRKPSSCHWSDLHVPGILLFCLLLFLTRVTSFGAFSCNTHADTLASSILLFIAMPCFLAFVIKNWCNLQFIGVLCLLEKLTLLSHGRLIATFQPLTACVHHAITSLLIVNFSLHWSSLFV